MANFTDLPIELAFNIAEHVEKRVDLAILTGVCRGFNLVFGSQLWKRLEREEIQRVLFWAVSSRTVSAAQRALSMATSPNISTQSHFNTTKNDKDFLDASKCDVSEHIVRTNSSVIWTWTPLNIASLNGYDDLVDLLLRHGADIDAACNVFSHWAPGNGLWDSGRTLDSCASSPLQTALHYGKESTARLLISLGASLTPMAEGVMMGIPPLHLAAKHGLLDVLKDMIQQHPELDINYQDQLGNTALVYAFFNRHWACFSYLHEKGADINIQVDSKRDHERMTGRQQMSLLESACFLGWYEDAIHLIASGVDVPKTSPLFHACMAQATGKVDYALGDVLQRRHWSVNSDVGLMLLIKTLTLKGADINLSWPGIGTPLYMSVQASAPRITAVFLHAGADIRIRIGAGKTLIDAACRAKPVFRMFELLLDRGAFATFDSLNISSIIALCEHQVDGDVMNDIVAGEKEKAACVRLLLAKIKSEYPTYSRRPLAEDIITACLATASTETFLEVLKFFPVPRTGYRQSMFQKWYPLLFERPNTKRFRIIMSLDKARCLHKHEDLLYSVLFDQHYAWSGHEHGEYYWATSFNDARQTMDEMMEIFLDHCGYLRKDMFENGRLLLWICQRGWHRSLRKLLEQGEDPTVPRGLHGRAPLQVALSPEIGCTEPEDKAKATQEMVAVLLEAGADPLCPCAQSSSYLPVMFPLKECIKLNNLSAFEIMLTQGKVSLDENLLFDLLQASCVYRRLRFIRSMESLFPVTQQIQTILSTAAPELLRKLLQAIECIETCQDLEDFNDIVDTVSYLLRHGPADTLTTPWPYHLGDLENQGEHNSDAFCFLKHILKGHKSSEGLHSGWGEHVYMEELGRCFSERVALSQSGSEKSVVISEHHLSRLDPDDRSDHADDPWSTHNVSDVGWFDLFLKDGNFTGPNHYGQPWEDHENYTSGYDEWHYEWLGEEEF
ncbi:hypothetical protein JX266_007382 [Neoarthrinium moseri]|nr:hypothetical protein JX266_007382 [Neoarthrinium moseri]